MIANKLIGAGRVWQTRSAATRGGAEELSKAARTSRGWGARVRPSHGVRVERVDRRTIEPFEPFENLQKFCNFLLNFGDLSGAKDCKSCRSRKMLKNDALVAKFGVDTAENEPS